MTTQFNLHAGEVLMSIRTNQKGFTYLSQITPSFSSSAEIKHSGQHAY